MEKPPKGKTIDRLQKTLDRIPELKSVAFGSPAFTKWRRDTRVAIANAFGEESKQANDFSKVGYTSLAVGFGSSSDGYEEEYYKNALDSAAAIISSMIDEIKEYWEDEERTSTPAISEVEVSKRQTTNRVFVAYGRDEELKEAMARLLERLELKPIILTEIPGQSQTIIEKFESNSGVGFAVALLTPDDIASLQGKGDRNPRARQNMIFELGFFIGSLGRDRVCALTKGEPEIPSNYASVEYIPIDEADGWKMKLVAELKAAGFEVDANRVFSS